MSNGMKSGGKKKYIAMGWVVGERGYLLLLMCTATSVHGNCGIYQLV